MNEKQIEEIKVVPLGIEDVKNLKFPESVPVSHKEELSRLGWKFSYSNLKSRPNSQEIKIPVNTIQEEISPHVFKLINNNVNDGLQTVQKEMKEGIADLQTALNRNPRTAPFSNAIGHFATAATGCVSSIVTTGVSIGALLGGYILLKQLGLA